MNELFIVAITEQGKTSMKQHLQEKYKESLKNKLLFKQICKESVFCEKPFTIRWELKHRYFTLEAVKPIIIDVMKENYSELDIDYKITRSEE